MAHARSCTAHLEELAVAGVSLEHGAVGLVGDPVGALDAADGFDDVVQPDIVLDDHLPAIARRLHRLPAAEGQELLAGPACAADCQRCTGREPGAAHLWVCSRILRLFCRST